LFIFKKITISGQFIHSICITFVKGQLGICFLIHYLSEEKFGHCILILFHLNTFSTKLIYQLY